MSIRELIESAPGGVKTLRWLVLFLLMALSAAMGSETTRSNLAEHERKPMHSGAEQEFDRVHWAQEAQSQQLDRIEERTIRIENLLMGAAE